jgi:hypothetical protein
MSFEKYEDKDKLLKLIDDFCKINSIEELATIVYLVAHKKKGMFSYEEEDFEDFSPLGPMSKKLFEDLFHLEVREKCVQRRSAMVLTEKGKERVQRLGNDVSFSDVRDILCQIDRDMWPKVVAFLYLRRKYGAPKAEEVLENSYGVDSKAFKTLREIASKLAP